MTHRLLRNSNCHTVCALLSGKDQSHKAMLRPTVSLIFSLVFVIMTHHTAIATFPISALSTTNSMVSCPASVTAGYPVRCTLKLFDASMNPWGDASDACRIRWSVCPNGDQSKGSGIIKNATHIVNGQYSMIFNPLYSGSNSVGVSLEESTLVTPGSITVYPASHDPLMSSSNCKQSFGVSKCTVEHRDTFGNSISKCSAYDSSIGQNNLPFSTCSVLSDPYSLPNDPTYGNY